MRFDDWKKKLEDFMKGLDALKDQKEKAEKSGDKQAAKKWKEAINGAVKGIHDWAEQNAPD